MKNLTLIALALFAAVSAQASTQLTFEEIKEACLDPAKFQNQMAPKNLQVTCEDRATKWQSIASTKVELERSREIISSLTSDKYSVEPTIANIPVDSQMAACPRFKEVLEVINFTKATSCEEILAFEGTETEFCADILDRVKQSNPKSVEVTDTGNEVDLCKAKELPLPPPDRCERGQRWRDGRCQR